MLTTIQSQCSKMKYINEDIVVNAIKPPRNSAIQENLLDYFFKHYVYQNHSAFSYSRQATLKYFFKNEPGVIGKYIYQIIEDGRGCREFDDYCAFKLYNHLGLDSKLVESLTPLVSSSSQFDDKSTVISALSQVMSTNDFLSLIAEYVPTNPKLDISDKDQCKVYQTQCQVAKCLKNLDDFRPLVPLLDYFCQGDYFQASRPLLYKVLYRVSENQAIDFIKLLTQKAVSVGKHAIYFGCALANHSTAVHVLQGFSNDEHVQKYVTKAWFRYCISNPTLPNFEMLCACFDRISMNDTEMFETLIQSSNKLPKQFQPALMVKIWTTIEQDTVHVKRFASHWMGQVRRFSVDMFSKFPEPFCGQMLAKYFLSDINIDTFVCLYLSVHQDEIHFSEVFSKMSKHKELHWNSKNYNEQAQFFTFFAEAYKLFPDRAITFLHLFKEHWQGLFSHLDCFTENIALDLMVIYMECPRIEDFAKKLHGILHRMITDYGTYINHLLLDGLTFLFKKRRVFGLCHVAMQLLEIEATDLNCFLAVNIAESASLPDEEKKRKELLSFLKTVDCFYVKLRYNTLQRSCGFD